VSAAPATGGRELTGGQLLVQWLGAAIARVRATGRRGIAWTVLGGAAGVAVALALPKQYTSTGTFIAQGASASELPAALQGIAASVGLMSARDFSPQFYADLLTSDPVLGAALTKPYRIPAVTGDTGRTYLEIERFRGNEPGRVMEQALRHLRRRVTARADVRTNIIALSVTARDPALSRDISLTLLAALDSLNIEFRQRHSGELRRFFETRVAESRHELDSAETRLRQFLERNRVIENSPLLTFEHLRLVRGADLKRAVYTTVVQQYEEARLQEARNVPVLTVLSPPRVPARKSGPPRRLIVALGLAAGLAVALAHAHVGSLRARLAPSRAAVR